MFFPWTWIKATLNFHCLSDAFPRFPKSEALKSEVSPSCCLTDKPRSSASRLIFSFSPSIHLSLNGHRNGSYFLFYTCDSLYCTCFDKSNNLCIITLHDFWFKRDIIILNGCVQNIWLLNAYDCAREKERSMKNVASNLTVLLDVYFLGSNICFNFFCQRYFYKYFLYNVRIVRRMM